MLSSLQQSVIDATSVSCELMGLLFFKQIFHKIAAFFLGFVSGQRPTAFKSQHAVCKLYRAT